MITVAQLCPKSNDWSARARSFWDPHSHTRIVAATPSSRPDLWEQFIDGADASYRRYGVSSALEFDTIQSGNTTSAFFAAIDNAGEVVAGVRAQGPYSFAHESHATIEWDGHTAGQAAIEEMITNRIPSGVLEMKSAWVAADAPYAKELAMTIGQTPSFALALFRARYAMATAAEHVLRAWVRTGAVAAVHIDAIPYPDERYRTSIIWWDRHTVPLFADPDQYRRISYGTGALLRTFAAYEAMAS